MNKRIVISIVLVLLLAVGAGYAIWNAQSDSQIAENAEEDEDFRYDSEEQKELAKDDDPSEGSEEFEGTDSGGGIIEVPYEGDTGAEGVSSDSGRITLQSPSPGSTIKSGDSLSGVTEVDTINYRIVDYERGVIGQGELIVSDGTFSGSIQIRPHGPKGTIELFTFNEVTSQEEDKVKIEIRFAQ